MATTYEIEGDRFSTLEEFFDEVGRVVLGGADWGRNLDALNDVLAGGFGTPEAGFTLRWKNHARSRQRLGYAETVRQLEHQLRRCHPANRDEVAAALQRANRCTGPTVFDWLVDIIQGHAPTAGRTGHHVRLLLA